LCQPRIAGASSAKLWQQGMVGQHFVSLVVAVVSSASSGSGSGSSRSRSSGNNNNSSGVVLVVVLVVMKKTEYPIPNVVSPRSQVEKNMAGQ